MEASLRPLAAVSARSTLRRWQSREQTQHWYLKWGFEG